MPAVSQLIGILSSPFYWSFRLFPYSFHSLLFHISELLSDAAKMDVDMKNKDEIDDKRDRDRDRDYDRDKVVVDRERDRERERDRDRDRDRRDRDSHRDRDRDRRDSGASLFFFSPGWQTIYRYPLFASSWR
jgi:hypothetical protein